MTAQRFNISIRDGVAEGGRMVFFGLTLILASLVVLIGKIVRVYPANYCWRVTIAMKDKDA